MLTMLFALFMLGTPQRPMSEMFGDCENYALDLSAEFKQWERQPQKLAAETKPTGKAHLMLNVVTSLALPLMKKVRFPAPPAAGRRGFVGVHGGMVKLRVPEKGSYRVCLGAKVWVDVVPADGTPLKTKGFEMQTECDQIFKVVRYELEADTDYWLQIAYGPEDSLKVLLSREP